MLRRVTTKHTIPKMGIESTIQTVETPKLEPQTETIEQPQQQTSAEWAITFGAMLTPFVAFCYFHHTGHFGRSLERIAKSRFGVHGFLALPFVTLSMEKCIYDTVQCLQGIDPKVVPEGRGGFPSGGSALPSFSLIPIQKRN